MLAVLFARDVLLLLLPTGNLHAEGVAASCCTLLVLETGLLLIFVLFLPAF